MSIPGVSADSFENVFERFIPFASPPTKAVLADGGSPSDLTCEDAHAFVELVLAKDAADADTGLDQNVRDLLRLRIADVRQHPFPQSGTAVNHTIDNLAQKQLWTGVDPESKVAQKLWATVQ